VDAIKEKTPPFLAGFLVADKRAIPLNFASGAAPVLCVLQNTSVDSRTSSNCKASVYRQPDQPLCKQGFGPTIFAATSLAAAYAPAEVFFDFPSFCSIQILNVQKPRSRQGFIFSAAPIPSGSMRTVITGIKLLIHYAPHFSGLQQRFR
jgi:hypothetical protein